MNDKRNRKREQDMPNRASNMEKAEGSRENARNSGGITNRPLDEEQQEQQHLPDRGRDAGRTSGGGSLGHDQPKDRKI